MEEKGEENLPPERRKSLMDKVNNIAASIMGTSIGSSRQIRSSNNTSLEDFDSTFGEREIEDFVKKKGGSVVIMDE